MSLREGSDIIMLNDVYFLAQNIAEEFELIARIYDVDDLKPAVEKVIRALEILEFTVKKNENLKVELANAVSNNVHLSSVKDLCYQERAHLKQSFEEAEELWLQEVADLKVQISSLKTENEQLKHLIFSKQENKSISEERLKGIIKDLEFVVSKLQLSLYQKEKHLQDIFSNESVLIDKVKELVEKNKILHTKNQESQQNIAQLIVEKDDCKNELIVLKKENALLIENVNEFVRSTSNKHMGKYKSDIEDSCEESVQQEIRRHIKIEMKLFEKLKKLQSELQQEKCKSKKYKDEILKNRMAENKYLFPDSKVHRFFHLFLGFISIPQHFWCDS